MAKTTRIQSIDRAVMILNCFTEKRSELRLVDISEMLDINKSTVHGILTTLKYHGFIDQDKDTQMYRLGLTLIRLGERVSNSIDIIKIAKPYIKDLCIKTNETVHLGKLDNTDIVYIDKVESTQSVRIITSVGTRIPAYSTGLGKVLLAYLKDSKVEKHITDEFKQFTNKTITNRNKFLEELVNVENNGYAIDKEENTVGLTCIAAPIFDNHNSVRYAISVSGPTARMDNKKIEQVKKLVKITANKISTELGN